MVTASAPSKSESRKSRTRDGGSSRRHSSQTESKDQGRRPTSELTSAAEMNALRAREVWEMDRLWKGDVGSTTSVNALGHGSAHTSYKLQQGFPFPAASGVYSSTSPPTQTMQTSLYEFPSGVRSYPDLATIPSIGSPDSTPSLPSRNPLPAPPRQSTYRPGPIPTSFMERSDSAAAEYWNKYAGTTTTTTTIKTDSDSAC
ncbi:hypothetical protein B0F90DRAFT_153421 [Multifurca ochricompacta]|uniref:Uncharacterized protein n=1 Tax=Multifurca ochricompacta TaxID=376703 RepID=A0AAD4MDU1_9AGAM|nr:hypothetical protein B0F90DRAFT_153421 [Multifurca ochricompacta]